MLVSSGLGAVEAPETDMAPPGLNLALPRQNWADRSNLSLVWPTRPSEAQPQHLPYGSGYEMRRGQRAESGIRHGVGAAPVSVKVVVAQFMQPVAVYRAHVTIQPPV